MSVVTPPSPPPEAGELEALIAEARARRRRRWSAWAAVIAVAAALGLGLWAGIPHGRSIAHGNGGGLPAAGNDSRQFPASGPRGPMYDLGTSGGVTWVRGLRGLWLTSDVGKTWRVIPLSEGVTVGSTGGVAQVEFADRAHGWILLDGIGSRESERYAELGRTTDGGRTWRWSRLNLCFPTCNGPASLSFLDRKHGYLDAGTELKGTLFGTSDGGAIWRRLHAVHWGPIAFLDQRRGFLVEPYITTGLGPNTGSLYVTADGGRTWERSALGRTGRIGENAPTVFGRRVVASAPYAIWVSRDAGKHWSVRRWPITDPMGFSGGFSAVSPTTWFAGQLKRLWLTRDGGRSWQPVALHDPYPTNPNANVLGLDFTSRLDGWALFGNTIFHTRDGGVRWTREEPVWHVVKHSRR